MTLKATSPARELLIPPTNVNGNGDHHNLVVLQSEPSSPGGTDPTAWDKHGDSIGTGRTVLIDAGATQTVLLEGESERSRFETIASVQLSSSELVVASGFLLGGQVVADASTAVRTQVAPIGTAPSHFELQSTDYADNTRPSLAIFNPTATSAAIKVECDGQVVIGGLSCGTVWCTRTRFAQLLREPRPFSAGEHISSAQVIRTAGSNVQPTMSPAKSAQGLRRSTAVNERKLMFGKY